MSTSLINGKNARSYIEFLKDAKIPFVLTCSNYTTMIKADNIINMKFVQTMMSNRCFAAFSKIKSDIKNVAPPDINKSQLQYFLHDFNRSFKEDEVMNIDLKSAYAAILYMDKIISDETFQYLSTIPKSDRLASVGMLASKKTEFYFDHEGVIVDVVEKRSEKENFFFYAVKRTFEIMTELRNIIGENYLFTWVDGIYFKYDHYAMLECAEYLDSIKFDFSAEILKNFLLDYSELGIKIEFYKEGKLKRLNLPPRNTEFNRIMADAMVHFHNLKNKTDETSKSKITGKQG